MNGAQSLIRTLVSCGVDVCFTNPGTSEMHFVAALDEVPEMRAVLALYEGVATGAADGYGRMAGKPAATLLHLGPGLANGIANLHNARRAHTPVVNVVGDHATYHQAYDAPLQSDIASLARPVSVWYRSSTSGRTLPADGAEAVVQARTAPGGVATLVVPADVSWNEAAPPAGPLPMAPPPATVPVEVVDQLAKTLQTGEPSVLLLGGPAMGERGLVAAARVAEDSGARLLAETFPAVHERGAGRPVVERLAYLAELTAMQLQGTRHLVLAGTVAPASFFAYPDKPSDLVPDGCEVHVLASARDDVVAALEALADALGAPASVTRQPPSRPEVPSGPLDAQSAAVVIGALLPEGAVVSDEANTAGIFVPGATAGCPPHTWLTLTGGAIGQGMPVATGAAVACPDRKVLCLEADGSAMYTLQSLWTQAREGLDVTTVVYANRSYAILAMELGRVGAGAGGERANRVLQLAPPALDFVALARGMGVPAWRSTTSEEFADHLRRALDEPGPALVEAVIGGPT